MSCHLCSSVLSQIEERCDFICLVQLNSKSTEQILKASQIQLKLVHFKHNFPICKHKAGESGVMNV